MVASIAGRNTKQRGRNLEPRIAKKGKDLYAWMSKAPNGPTVKMHLQNREFLLASLWLHNLTNDMQYIPWRSSTSLGTA